MASTLLYKGKEEPVSIAIIKDPKLQFKPGASACRVRGDKNPDLFVLHWTAGEGGNAGVFNVLRNRKLSVQFQCDQKGKLIQYCDAHLICGHSGKFNPRSIGIEISNVGTGKINPKFPRQRYKGEINGRTVYIAEFYPIQIKVVADLIEEVCRITGILRQIPVDEKGEIWNKTLTPKQSAAFKGVVNHFHISSKKKDAGFDMITELKKRGFVGVDISKIK